MIVSGGNGTDGNGTLRINTGDITVNGNTVWHAGNDGSTSQLDAHYLDGYVQSTSATANTIARRDASGHLTVNDLTADQGIFNNSGTSTLSLGGASGVTVGAPGSVLYIQSKATPSKGLIKFGSDSKYFGYAAPTGDYLYYGSGETNPTMVWRGEKVGIGNLSSDPSSLLHLRTNSGDAELRITAGSQFTNPNADPLIRFTGQDDSTSEGMILKYDNSVGDFYFDQVYTGLGAAAAAMHFRVDAGGTPIEGMHLRGDGGVTIKETLRAEKQIISSVAQGTAPFSVTSNTVVTNLNADLLDGYSALSLPYLQGLTNTSITSTDGQRRFYFANNSYTALAGVNDLYFQIGTTSFARMGGSGRWNLHGDGSEQTTYRLSVRGSNGLNIDATESLSSGQKSTVLRAGGDKQYIDTYGVFKRNRNNIGENIQVNNGDNCMSAGPMTINNGVTVTVNNGGSWTVV